MSCPELNSKNNGQGLLFKTVLWRLLYFLSFVATDGKDGNGLKLEKDGPKYQNLWCYLTKNKQKKTYIMGCSISKHFIRYLSHSLLGTFYA